MILFHGGVAGLRPGDHIDASRTRPVHVGCAACEANARGEAHDASPLTPDGYVYGCTDRLYARYYASLVGLGTLYRIELDGDIASTGRQASDDGQALLGASRGGRVIPGGSVTAEHTPPTAAEVALDVLMKDWDAWAERGQWASPASRDRRRSRVARGHRAMIAKLAAAGLLRPDTPSAALVDAAKAYLDATLNPTLEHNPGRGEPPRWKHEPQRKALADALAGLVAGSDDSTDTLAEQVIEPGDEIWRTEDGWKVDHAFRASDGPTLNAALRAALASQPKGT